jgi:RNA polymerase sigma factor (sigma-70 family)
VEGVSDEALLAGLGSGNPEASAAFIRRFQGRVYGLAMTMLRDPDIAEDVAQETFVRVWRHAATYDARRGRVPTWVLAIARNLAIDRTRLRSATPVDPELIASELELATEDAPVDIAERERVRQAVVALPDGQRRALVLAMYAGRTAREISELDGVALGTVKTRIRAAMLKLRDTLAVHHEL